MTNRTPPPLSPSRPNFRALDSAADLLADVGTSALTDDDLGPAWAAWADHCWRAGRPAHPIDDSSYATYCVDLDDGELRALAVAVAMANAETRTGL